MRGWLRLVAGQLPGGNFSATLNPGAVRLSNSHRHRHGDHFMKITNFMQGGGTDRAVVEVVLPGDTENGGSTNVLTATRVDFSTGANAQKSPEINYRVTIAGPAIVKIRPIVGAKLFITYKKERDEGSGGGGGGGGASPTVIPIFSPTPGVTPTPTSNPFISPTPF